MIMFFADAHLEHRLYHEYTDNFLTTSEVDSRIALDGVYKRASQSDIELIIFGGDYFHVSKPSTENIRWMQEWFKNMDSLDKPFYVIPGNHDVSSHSHSLVSLHSLGLKNIFLLEHTVSKITWNDWNIYFLPFLCPKSSKNKYASTLHELNSVFKHLNPLERNLVISHVQERESKLGSESGFIARAVDIIDLDNEVEYENTTFLMGHIHRAQAYKKRNGINVIYPGSLSYLEHTDCGQRKGYVLISKNGDIDFESIPGIRVYKRYMISEDKNIFDFFDSIRMSNNDVVFIDVESEESLLETEVREYLKGRGCSLGKIRYAVKGDDNIVVPEILSVNPLLSLEEFLSLYFKDNPTFDWRNKILSLGKEFLSNAD